MILCNPNWLELLQTNLIWPELTLTNINDPNRTAKTITNPKLTETYPNHPKKLTFTKQNWPELIQPKQPETTHKNRLKLKQPKPNSLVWVSFYWFWLVRVSSDWFQSPYSLGLCSRHNIKPTVQNTQPFNLKKHSHAIMNHSTEGSCLMLLLGPGKIRISQKSH